MTAIDDEAKAAQQFRGYILEKLTDERGVHAETAVAAAARMAGTFLLRSCNVPLARLEPGTPVLSDAVNERGPLLVEILGVALQGMNVAIDMTRARAGGAALLTVPQTQALLELGMIALKDRCGLDYERGARAAALATALLIKDTAVALDPSTAFGIAAYGFVEGAKTVPPRLPAVTPPPATMKPWYKIW